MPLDYREWEKDERYHHRFRLHDPEAGLSYPNSLEIHTLELPKRPLDSDGSGLWKWLAFLSLKTRDEVAIDGLIATSQNSSFKPNPLPRPFFYS